jgi:hypothetical protein
MSDKSERYLHISISAMNAEPPRIWVQWTRDRNRTKAAQWENAYFRAEDRDEIKQLLNKIVTEL